MELDGQFAPRVTHPSYSIIAAQDYAAFAFNKANKKRLSMRFALS
jgi:hypothetical protein